MLGVLLFTILILFIIFVSSRSNNKIPKIIWTFWDGSEKPLLVKKCMETWEKWAPDYEIRVLDKESTKHIQQLKRASDHIQRYSDFVRLDVLSKYGGIWMDASIYLTRPLDWIYEEQSEFIGYKCLGQQSDPDIPVIDNWFLACVPNCKYMKDWYEEFKRMDTFNSVVEYLDSLDIDYSKVYGPEYLVMHVSSMVIRSKNNYSGMRLLVSEDDAGAIFSNKISLEDFCNGSRDEEVRMIKLNGGNRRDLEKMKCNKFIN